MAQATNYEKFGGLAEKALDDLGNAKHELEERELQIRDLAMQSSARFSELMRVNSELKEKIDFLQDLATNLSLRNEELEKKNHDLEIQKAENTKLESDLRKNLEKVVLKEKELELQRDQLERQVNEKTDELIKSQKLAIIGELASRMAHDLRNPLSTIKNVVELMENKQKLRIEEKIIYYGKLHRAIDRISHQVDDVLEYGKASQLQLQSVNITSMIKQIIVDNNFSKDVKVNVDNVDLKLSVDARKMEAVITNLLINAVQAIDNKGTINIRILDNGSNAIFAIEDSGPGIPPQNISKIFDPLFTTKQTGTGLGLSICKKIIEQHGGNISVKNNPTTFIVRLPKNLNPQA
ncbi:sensor histidine kinase [Candidatus Nitrosotenuis aquarius]|uniref:sensor histidine kinase n=1 Tax=Candidatus Nitrosotenuis aquarius TaxID=1846278 RepID=UPI000C1E78B1|nr:ATP-binding protein [Candidatus Nitrosotenuis aquarius]